MLSPEILFEDANFLIVYKPCSIEMHNGETGIIPRVQAVIKDFSPLFLVHRLDKDTSGILLLAKTNQAASELSQSFARRDVEKYYVALGHGKPKKKQGLIKGDMLKSRNGSYKLVNSHSNPAVTQFFTKSFASNIRLFVLKPYTGKTHQLRVALKSNSTPILGDQRYASQTIQPSMDRMYLHAGYLKFTFNEKQHLFCCSPKEGELWKNKISESDIHSFSELAWPALPIKQ